MDMKVTRPRTLGRVVILLHHRGADVQTDTHIDPDPFGLCVRIVF